MDKNQIIEFLGSSELYEEYRRLVIDELKSQIETKGLATHFEGTNVYEQFADFYIQGWINSRQRWVDEVNAKKNRVFSQEEINQYIIENPIVPQDIEEIDRQEFILSFEEKELPTELKQKKEAYYKNPQLLSEEEAQTLLEKENEDDISNIMQYFNLENFEKDLNRHKSNFLNVKSDPKEFGISRRLIKSVLMENTGIKPSINAQPEDCKMDFEVNSKQIIIASYLTGDPFIYAYIPNQEYPKGTLRSTLIQKENESKFKEELRTALSNLKENYAGKVNVGRLSEEVLNEFIGKDNIDR